METPDPNRFADLSPAWQHSNEMDAWAAEQVANEQRIRFANAYEVTLGYGGPEEGGWWYDVGTPLASIPVETPEDEQQARETIERVFRPQFVGNRGKASVAPFSSDLVVLIEDEMAKAYPDSKPYYE